MHPILFYLGPIPIPAFGVMALLAFGACILVIRHYARIEGVSAQGVLDAIVFACVAGVFGAKLLHAALISERLAANPREILLLPFQGGVYLAAVFVAVPVAAWWLRRQRIPMTKGLDIFAMAGALSFAIARWGCFLAGCCYGAPTDLPWGVTFPPIAHHVHSDMPEGPLHPTQIYLSLASFAAFVTMAWLYRRPRRFPLQITAVYFMFYGATRFAIEYVRGDAVRGVFFDGWLSTSQILSAVMIGAGVALYAVARRRGPVTAQPVARARGAQRKLTLTRAEASATRRRS